MILVVIPPEPTSEADCAGHGLDLGRDRADLFDELRHRVLVRIGAKQPFDVGQQDQAVGARHLRDARGQPVVVAVADFRRGNGVVLVDDRKGPERQQRIEGGAGVQVAAPRFGVLERQQNLRDGDFAASSSSL